MHNHEKNGIPGAGYEQSRKIKDRPMSNRSHLYSPLDKGHALGQKAHMQGRGKEHNMMGSKHGMKKMSY